MRPQRNQKIRSARACTFLSPWPRCDDSAPVVTRAGTGEQVAVQRWRQAARLGAGS
eukprot:COSAG01_NODE_66569_length_269_cov_1.782353_1_plen_55_part_01